MTAGLHAACARPDAVPSEQTGFGGRSFTCGRMDNYPGFPEIERFRATPAIQEKAFENEKISFILCNVVTEITGGPEGVAGLSLRNLENSGVTELPVSGVFIFVGIKPNSDFIPPEVERDSSGFISPTRKWLRAFPASLLPETSASGNSAKSLRRWAMGPPQLSMQAATSRTIIDFKHIGVYMNYFRHRSKKMLRLSGFVFMVFALFILNGCSGTDLKQFYFGDLFGKGSKTIDKTADQLAVEGTQKLQQKDYGGATEDFKKLKEHYPYSKFAILAELKLGDAYFHDKKYNEASMAYEEFVRLHPRNEVVPYVLYQIGMSHFLTFTTVDRDPEETSVAVQAFDKVIKNFPNSEYARKAEKQLFECKKRIVSHEYAVARFYVITEEYAAAKGRLDAMVQKYPQAIADLGYGDSVTKMLAKCEAEVAKGEKKPGFWTKAGF